MNESEALLAMFSVFCGTGTLCFIVYVVKQMVVGRGASKELTAEMKALREEVAQLRARNNDVLLSVESVQQRLERGLLGAPALPRGEAQREEEVPLRTGR